MKAIKKKKKHRRRRIQEKTKTYTEKWEQRQTKAGTRTTQEDREQTNRRRVKEKSQTWIHRGWWTNNTQVSSKKTKTPNHDTLRLKSKDSALQVGLTWRHSKVYTVLFFKVTFRLAGVIFTFFFRRIISGKSLYQQENRLLGRNIQTKTRHNGRNYSWN